MGFFDAALTLTDRVSGFCLWSANGESGAEDGEKRLANRAGAQRLSPSTD